MFFSLMAYLFLALIYKEVHAIDQSVSLISIRECLKVINLIYATNGKSVITRIECKSDISELIVRTMDLESMVKD